MSTNGCVGRSGIAVMKIDRWMQMVIREGQKIDRQLLWLRWWLGLGI